MLLNGKVAIITGSGTGMGKATALLFAKEGATIALFGRREEKLKEVEKEIKAQSGKNAIVVSGDVANIDNVRMLVNETIKEFKKIDILVNNAGIFRGTQFQETETSEWDEVMETNLKGAFLLTKEVIPHMISNKGGAIINIASILGMVAIPNASAYNTSKGGLVMFTKSIAMEYANQNIRANCICPGLVATPMTKDFMAETETMKEIIKDYPMGRFGKPEDIAYPCLFLASEWSSWITGTVLPVDGGYTAK
ncbi:MAG: SDR family NAD(P)-dependent oxidoreductase [Candidatus Anammoxibacter sp.]